MNNIQNYYKEFSQDQVEILSRELRRTRHDSFCYHKLSTLRFYGAVSWRSYPDVSAANRLKRIGKEMGLKVEGSWSGRIYLE